MGEGLDGMVPALQRVCEEAAQAVKDGYSLICLTDRKVSADYIPIP